MMKILIRCAKASLILSVLIGSFILFDYFCSTSDSALKQNHWLIRTMNDAECTDIYRLTDVDIPMRNQSWSVEYRFVDVILTLYHSDGSVTCDYASK